MMFWADSSNYKYYTCFPCRLTLRDVGGFHMCDVTMGGKLLLLGHTLGMCIFSGVGHWVGGRSSLAGGV